MIDTKTTKTLSWDDVEDAASDVADAFGGAVDDVLGTDIFGDRNTVIEGERLARAQIQMAAYGRPMPIIYGTQRIAPTLIWLDEFTAIRHEEETSAGKGGETTITNVTYTYTACVVLAICEGPVLELQRVWADKSRFLNPPSAGFTTYLLGTRPQTPWTHFTSKHPAEALGYGGTVLVAAEALSLGASGALDNYNFEVKGVAALYAHNYLDPVTGSAMVAYDAHPADVITDLLTSVLYGGGLSAARIAAMTLGQDGLAASSFITYCHAFGIYLSPMISDQRSLLDWLRDILAAANAAAVWSEGVLKVYPYGDTGGSGNGYTYVPATAAQYDLTTDDFLAERGEDPIVVHRRRLRDTNNIIPVEFLDRTQDYKATPVEDADQADVEAFGERRGSTIGLHMICRKEVALMASRLNAQRSVWVRTEYRFRLPWRYALLEPMDLVTLTEPKLGLDHRLVRLVEVEEDEDGTLKFAAEECPLGLSTHTVYTPQASDGILPPKNTDPGNVNTPFLMKGPALNTGGAELWVAASGSSALWGGADVFVSEDNATYQWVGRIHAQARHGTLTAVLAAGTPGALDSTNTLAVQLARTDLELSSTSADGRDAGLTLVALETGELLAFTTATLTGVGAYNLTVLRRGMFGGTAGGGASASKWARLDDAIFKYAVPATKLGKTLYVKLASFNIYGGGAQDLAAVTAYSIVVAASAVTQPVQQTAPVQKGAVVTASIAPAAVTVTELANNAVTDLKLNAGAVTVTKLGTTWGAGNLLRNSSFETDSDSNGFSDWWSVYNNSSVLQPHTLSRVSGGLYGGMCQRVRWEVPNTTTKGLYTGATLIFNGKGGGTLGGWRRNVWYTISVYVRASDTNINKTMSLGWNAGPDTQVTVQNPALTTDWQRYVWRLRWVTAPLPGDVLGTVGELFFTIQSNSQSYGDLDFDAAQVEEGEVVTGYAPMTEEILPGTVGTNEITALSVTAAKIAANTITAAQIAANTITAGEIAAGAIATDELAAGAVTAVKVAAKAILAQHLVLTNFENLVPNGYVTETAPPAGSFEAAGLFNYGSGFSVSGWYKQSLAIGATGYGRLVLTPYIPVVPGEQYLLRGRGCKGSSTGSAYLEARFYNKLGVVTGASETTSTFPLDAAHTAGAVQSVAFTVPADAATMTVSLTYYGAVSNNWVDAAEILLKKMTDASLIVDGTIIATKIAAGAIEADKIAADALATTNFASTGTGINEVATAGAKMQNAPSGVALITCKDGLKVGERTLEDMFAHMAVSNPQEVVLPGALARDYQAIAEFSKSATNLTYLLAVGASLAAYSVDGGNLWTGQTTAVTWFDVAAMTQMAVRCGINNSARTSDGVTWTAITTSAASWVRVVFTGGAYARFVMLNSAGGAVSQTELNLYLGSAWTTSTFPTITGVTFYDMASDFHTIPGRSGTGGVVAVGLAGGNLVYVYSTNGGQTFTQGTLPGTIATTRRPAVGYSHPLGLWMIYGGTEADPIIYTSSDMVNWTADADVIGASTPSGSSGFIPQRLVWGDPIWVMAGRIGADPCLAVSKSDGKRWSMVDTHGSTVNGLCYGIGRGLDFRFHAVYPSYASLSTPNYAKTMIFKP